MEQSIILIVIVFVLVGLWLIFYGMNNGVEFKQTDLIQTDTIGLNLTNLNIFFDVETTVNTGVIMFLQSFTVPDAFSTVTLEVVNGVFSVKITAYSTDGGAPVAQRLTSTSKINDGKFHEILVLLTPLVCIVVIDGVININTNLQPYPPIQAKTASFGGYGFAGHIRNVKFGNVDKTIEQ